MGLKIIIVFLVLTASKPAELTRSKSIKRALSIQNYYGVSSTISPGIQYAIGSNDQHADQAPSRRQYPISQRQYPISQSQYPISQQRQIAKISDVFTSQGVSYPRAIENYLDAPHNVYQSLGKNKYEVSGPIQSRLMYSEHQVTYPTSFAPTLTINNQSPLNHQQYNNQQYVQTPRSNHQFQQYIQSPSQEQLYQHTSDNHNHQQRSSNIFFVNHPITNAQINQPIGKLNDKSQQPISAFYYNQANQGNPAFADNSGVVYYQNNNPSNYVIRKSESGIEFSHPGFSRNSAQSPASVNEYENDKVRHILPPTPSNPTRSHGYSYSSLIHQGLIHHHNIQTPYYNQHDLTPNYHPEGAAMFSREKPGLYLGLGKQKLLSPILVGKVNPLPQLNNVQYFGNFQNLI